MVQVQVGLDDVAHVYRYFGGKDDVISAAVLDGTAGLGEALRPILSQDDPPPPAEFTGQILRAILAYGDRSQIDLTRVALHGWSHSRSQPELRVAVGALQRGVRDHYAQVCRRWQASGMVDPGADPLGIAELMLSITLGFIAQRSLAGNAEVDAHVAALAALIR